MRKTFRGLLLACGLLAAAPVSAQDIHTPPQFSEGDAKGAIIDALRRLSQVNCGRDRCTPATPEEFATPPVQIEDARFALRTGAKSAQLAWCGLDWLTRTHAFMMRAFQQKYGANERAIAVLRMIHAVQQGRNYSNLQVLKTCTPRMRAELEEQNPPVIQTASQQMIEQVLRDESVSKMLQLVLDRMPEANCGPQKKCDPATAEEKAKPPVSIEDGRRAMAAGLMSGTAKHCNLDWKQKIFLPMMAYHRRKLHMNDRQMAITSVLHSTMQAFMLAGYQQRGEVCSEAMRTDISNRLDATGKASAASKGKDKPKSNAKEDAKP